jgi:hypothetical protein
MALRLVQRPLLPAALRVSPTFRFGTNLRLRTPLLCRSSEMLQQESFGLIVASMAVWIRTLWMK